jgi:cell wall-associated NlpC family hydrolase
VAAATIAALFSPVPALAAPNVPAAPIAPAVPDPGSRPFPLGTLTMPGQTATAPGLTTTGATVPVSVTPTGVATSPLLAKIEKKRADVAALGDQLIKLGEDRDLARRQLATADQMAATAQAALTRAQQDAAATAVATLRDAAALPPGTIGSGLDELGSLAAIQQGDSPGEEAAARQVALAQAAQQAALVEQSTATANATDVSGRYETLNADIGKKQSELQKLEQQNADALNAADAAETAQDATLGAQYLAGANEGRGADARALAALRFALAQRGDPYVWSEEGPNQYDCSGLMYAAYHSKAAGNYPLTRVSRDQYWQTHEKAVDRYSLLPGDMLFFSSSSSWTDIHHVAMYAGHGMMVEAPRTGLNVRLTPVRWSRLFQATRVYGSVDGPVKGPVLGSPDPDPTTKPPIKPTTKPPTKPPTKPTTPTTPTTPTATATATATTPTSGSSSGAGSTQGNGSSPTGSTAQAQATTSAAMSASG